MKTINEELQEQREKLNLLILSGDDLSSGEILAQSQELDKLIVKIQNQGGKNLCQQIKHM